MPDPRFFQRAGPYAAHEIAAWTGAKASNESDLGREVSDLADLANAGPSDLCYLASPQYINAASGSAAAACFATASLAESLPIGTLALVVEDPQAAFAIAAEHFYPKPPELVLEVEHSPTGALVHPNAIIADDVVVEAGAVIGPGVTIGARSRIGPAATIGSGCVVGEDCVVGANVALNYCVMGSSVIVHPGVCIGQDGFGFVFDSVAGRHRKVPQLGRVIIHDDVEIGANTTVDRGALDDTVIGEGCRIDNQVQIGHNVTLGQRCIIVSQVGLSGSCTIGDDVVIAGQVGLADHVTVGPKAQIAAKSGVMRDIPPGSAVMGYPAKPIRTFWREVAAVGRLTGKAKSS